MSSKRSTPVAEVEGIAALLPGAALGIGLAVQRVVFDRVAAVEARLQVALARVGRTPPLSGLREMIHAQLVRWDAEYQEHRRELADLATDYLAASGPQTLDELLARIDVEALLDRVDIDALLDGVDLDAVVERVSIEKVIDRIDIGSVVLDTVGQVQVSDLLREGTGVMASTTADLLRDQRRNAARLAGLPFRR